MMQAMFQQQQAQAQSQAQAMMAAAAAASAAGAPGPAAPPHRQRRGLRRRVTGDGGGVFNASRVGRRLLRRLPGPGALPHGRRAQATVEMWRSGPRSTRGSSGGAVRACAGG